MHVLFLVRLALRLVVFRVTWREGRELVLVRVW
jgi:hypothetical protein